MDTSLKRARSSSPERNEQQKKKPKVREIEVLVPWFDYVPSEGTVLKSNIVDMLRFGPHLQGLQDFIRTESASVQREVAQEISKLGVREQPCTLPFHWSVTRERDTALLAKLTGSEEALASILAAYRAYCTEYMSTQAQEAFLYAQGHDWFNAVFRPTPSRNTSVTPLASTCLVDTLLVIANVPATFVPQDLDRFLEGHRVERVFLGSPQDATGVRHAVLQFASEKDMRSQQASEDALFFCPKDASAVVAEECKYSSYSIGAKNQTQSVEGTVAAGLENSLLLTSKQKVQFTSLPRQSPGFVGPLQWILGPVPAALSSDSNRQNQDQLQAQALLIAFDQANHYNRSSYNSQSLSQLVRLQATEYAYCYYSGNQFPSYADYLLQIGTQYLHQDNLVNPVIDANCTSVSQGVNGIFAWKRIQSVEAFAKHIDAAYTQRLETLRNSGKFSQIDENFALGSKFTSRSQNLVKCTVCDAMLRQNALLEHIIAKHPTELSDLKHTAEQTYIIANYRNIQNAQRTDVCCRKQYELCKCALGMLAVSSQTPNNCIEKAIRRTWKANDKFQPKDTTQKITNGASRTNIVYTHRYNEKIPRFSIKLW